VCLFVVHRGAHLGLEPDTAIRRAGPAKENAMRGRKGAWSGACRRRPTRSEAFHHLAPASSHLIQSHPANVILTSTRRTTSGALRTGLSVRQRWGPSLFPAPDDADPVGALIHVLVLPQERDETPKPLHLRSASPAHRRKACRAPGQKTTCVRPLPSLHGQGLCSRRCAIQTRQ
jgi:hypothetical protein